MTSKYKDHVRDLIGAAIERPEMVVGGGERLRLLQQMLIGHSSVYSQLGLIQSNEETFHDAFGTWLGERYNLSWASGWVHALERVAEKKEVDAWSVFVERVTEFLKEW